MPLTLQNFRKQLPPLLVKKASKIHIRECDEVQPGHFQAYADEKDTSFDVSLAFDKKGSLTAQSCDCGSGDGFCRHMAALIGFITREKPGSAPRRTRKKKVDPLDLLVEEADEQELKSWLQELLRKNKDLALSFQQKFSATPQVITPQRVRELTRSAVISVAGKRSKLDVSEVKKIITLWKEVHEPIIQDYLHHMGDPSAFANIVTLLDACADVRMRIRTTSTRLEKYPNDLLEKLKEPLHDLQVDGTWEKATDLFIALLRTGGYDQNRYLVNFLHGVCQVSQPPRSSRLAAKLVQWFDGMKAAGIYTGQECVHLMFKIAVDYGLFAENPKRFTPTAFDNAYNIALINQIIATGDLRTAARYCHDQIAANFREQYNTPYLMLLKQIYAKTGDTVSQSGVLRKLFNFSMDFADFSFVYDHLDSVREKEAWRSEALQHARNRAASDIDANRFIFRLFAGEKNYKKIIESISYYTPYSLLLEYADSLSRAGGEAFLDKLLAKPEYNYFPEGSAAMTERKLIYGKLEQILSKHFSKKILKAAAQKGVAANPYGRTSSFARYLTEKLG